MAVWYPRQAGAEIVTLGYLQGHRMGLFCCCRSCGHTAPVPVAPLIARFGQNFRALDLKVRCGGCGARGDQVEMQPDWVAVPPPADPYARRR